MAHVQEWERQREALSTVSGWLGCILQGPRGLMWNVHEQPQDVTGGRFRDAVNTAVPHDLHDA